MTDIAELNALDSKELAARLTGPPVEAAAFVRSAAEAGSGEAQLVYGQMRLDGHGVPRAPIDALRWFVRAAQQGHPLGANMVGRCYENGWGIVADAAKAAEWYEAAAKRGSDWGMYNLATLLALGRGVPPDRTRALALFRKAAARGHAKSITMVGGFYEDGWVVARDMAEAADHYRRGAEAGDFRGMFNHARMLVDAGDRDTAIGWLRRLPASATPAFLDKAAEWLERSGDPALAAMATELRCMGSQGAATLGHADVCNRNNDTVDRPDQLK